MDFIDFTSYGCFWTIFCFVIFIIQLCYIFGWTDSGVLFSRYENRKKAMYQAAHHEMVAGAIVVKKGHEINPDFKIGCMCSFVPFYPLYLICFSMSTPAPANCTNSFYPCKYFL